MQYVLAAGIVIVIAAALLAFTHVQREAKLVPRQSLMTARQAVRRSKHLVVAGDQCVCGGILGPSGRVSEKFGPTLGCTGCTRSWTMNGRRILSRPARRSTPIG